MNPTIETELETETGRWIAEVMELPGCLKYSPTRDAAIKSAKVLALEVIAGEIERGDRSADLVSIAFKVAAQPAGGG